MKKLVSTSYLVLFSILYFSCSKNESHYILAKEELTERLDSDIYPVATKPGEMVIGNEQSICMVGETVTLFLPYQVISDDIQNATIVVTDALTGETVRQLAMTFSTDISVLNVTVPEEIQGSSFMFVNIPVENDLIGRTLNVATKIIAIKQTSEDAVNNAFQVQ
jgi:hypothetical protein